MSKKKRRFDADCDNTAEANRRRLEEVQRFWSDEAMEAAMPLPIEYSPEEGPRDNGPYDPAEVDKKEEG